MALLRPPEDRLPTSGFRMDAEINAVRYELTVRVPGLGKVYLIVRAYDNGDGGISVRYVPH